MDEITLAPAGRYYRMLPIPISSPFMPHLPAFVFHLGSRLFLVLNPL